MTTIIAEQVPTADTEWVENVDPAPICEATIKHDGVDCTVHCVVS